MKSDVLVVGAGPAGLATAIAAASRGLRVTIADVRRPPINKPCGEGLLPDAVEALRKIGIGLDFPLGFPLEGFRFSDGTRSACAPISRGRALGLRRTVLHELLVTRAAELGVQFCWGARVSDFEAGGARVGGEFLNYRWLVGADGLHSAVRRWAGLNWPRISCRTRFGFRRHFAVVPWSKFVEVYWGRRFQMVVTPTGCDEVCVSFFSRDPGLRVEHGLGEFPEVARRVEKATPLTAQQGTQVGLTSAWHVAAGRVALVGDASCSVDGIAGHGLSLGLQAALALGEALARGDMRSYHLAHRRIVSLPLRMTRLLLLMDASGWIRKKTLRLFEHQPDLFAKIIAVHTSKPHLEAFGARDIFGLSWRVLWA
ncbi:MAG TPA: FAD-dependent monooxygenase [Candidatus Acidoferrum sp.]|nr:FAD-dependent monooxygenase [Candidatus Acidoferrum sp.]